LRADIAKDRAIAEFTFFMEVVEERYQTVEGTLMNHEH
jgi:hypothetical protein